MADETIPEDVNQLVEESLGEAAPSKRSRKKKRGPSYKMVGDSKIPVAKSLGKVWKSRYELAKKNHSELSEAWEEAIRYYENDQQGHRAGRENQSGNTIGNQRLNTNITETENVVFANVTTMVPALYSRNPKAEFTSHREADKRFATILERLVNVIGQRKAAPGMNIKPKAKRSVVTTLLTNRSWIKIGWTHKKDSSEEALADLQKLGQQLEKAKTSQQIEEIEGRIMALEKSIDMLEASGPFAKARSPFHIMFDPNADEIDLSDANWLVELDYLPTQFLYATYGTKKKGSTQYTSVFAPTHVIKAGKELDESHADEQNFSLFDKTDEASKHGYDDEDAYEKAKMTKVCYVWDKVTRRVLLFNYSDWTWPLWVWDDPLRLDTFFPYYPLTFFDSPDGTLAKGEVTYYLDQQDAINEIVDEERRARKWARRNVFFNKNLVSEDDVVAVLNGDDGTAKGLDLPQDMKLQDVLGSILPPSMQFKELFDKEGKYTAIDRISSTGEVMRGAQFKTNTNTSAVQANVSASNMRVDEKTDAIEDWMGQIYWGLAQLCLQYMSVDEVVALVGEEAREVWRNMEPEEIKANFSVTVLGGSSKKPTSAAKKEEAIQLGQVLGQFANASPHSIVIAIKAMEQAFDEVTVSEEDWASIRSGLEQQMQGQQQGPAQQPEQPPEPQTGSPLGPTGPSPANASPDQLKQLIDQLPPEIKAQMEAAVQSGVDPQAALKEAIQLAQGQADNQPTIQ